MSGSSRATGSGPARAVEAPARPQGPLAVAVGGPAPPRAPAGGYFHAGIEEDQIAALDGAVGAEAAGGARPRAMQPVPCLPGCGLSPRPPVLRHLSSCSRASSPRDVARSSSTSILRISWLPENWSVKSLTAWNAWSNWPRAFIRSRNSIRLRLASLTTFLRAWSWQSLR